MASRARTKAIAAPAKAARSANDAFAFTLDAPPVLRKKARRRSSILLGSEGVAGEKDGTREAGDNGVREKAGVGKSGRGTGSEKVGAGEGGRRGRGDGGLKVGGIESGGRGSGGAKAIGDGVGEGTSVGEPVCKENASAKEAIRSSDGTVARVETRPRARRQVKSVYMRDSGSARPAGGSERARGSVETQLAGGEPVCKEKAGAGEAKRGSGVGESEAKQSSGGREAQRSSVGDMGEETTRPRVRKRVKYVYMRDIESGGKDGGGAEANESVDTRLAGRGDSACEEKTATSEARRRSAKKKVAKDPQSVGSSRGKAVHARDLNSGGFDGGAEVANGFATETKQTVIDHLLSKKEASLSVAKKSSGVKETEVDSRPRGRGRGKAGRNSTGSTVADIEEYGAEELTPVAQREKREKRSIFSQVTAAASSVDGEIKCGKRSSLDSTAVVEAAALKRKRPRSAPAAIESAAGAAGEDAHSPDIDVKTAVGRRRSVSQPVEVASVLERGLVVKEGLCASRGEPGGDTGSEQVAVRDAAVETLVVLPAMSTDADDDSVGVAAMDIGNAGQVSAPDFPAVLEETQGQEMQIDSSVRKAGILNEAPIAADAMIAATCTDQPRPVPHAREIDKVDMFGDVNATPARPSSSSRRRVRFDPAIPSTPTVSKPILRAVYTARGAVAAFAASSPRRRRIDPEAQERRRAAVAAAAAATPINVTAAVDGAETPAERAIVDQLQYLLDGVTNGAHASVTASRRGRKKGGGDGEQDDHVLIENLVKLAELFLKMAPPLMEQRAEAAAEVAAANAAASSAGDSGTMAKAESAAAQAAEATKAANSPSMLLRLGCGDGGGSGNLMEQIVTRLLTLRGRSVAVCLLVGTIMLILARSDANDSLFGKGQIAVLVDSFYKVLPAIANGLASEGSERSGSSCASGDTGGAPTGPKRRRRGRLARKLEARSAAENDSIICRVRKLLIGGCGLEAPAAEQITADRCSVASLFGMALAAVLEVNPGARNMMTERQRIHRIVAVLIQSEKMCRGARATKERAVGSPAVAVALRILEAATLHRGCQDQIALESKIVEAAVSVLQLGDIARERVVAASHVQTKSERAASGDGDGSDAGSGVVEAAPVLVPRHDDVSLADALRLCVNLTHDCEVGLTRFVSCGGVSTVLDLIASPAVWPRPDSLALGCLALKEMYDIRVLSLALLASVVSQNKKACGQFQNLQTHGVAEREGGAVTFVLELLKLVGDDSASSAPPGRIDQNCAGPVKGTDVMDLDDLPPVGKPGQAAETGASDDGDVSRSCMEQRVVTGYLCLLLGALSVSSIENRGLIESAMPGASLAPIADVLDEFLGFHHELGIVSTGVDEMYQNIIVSIRDEDDDDDDDDDDGGGGGARQLEAADDFGLSMAL